MHTRGSLPLDLGGLSRQILSILKEVSSNHEVWLLGVLNLLLWTEAIMNYLVLPNL